MRNTKLFRFVVMSVLVCSATASSAQAWTTNGPVQFTATAGGALFRFNSPTPAGLICQGPNAVRGTPNASTPMASSWRAVNSLSFTWTNCTVAGFSMSRTCTTAGTLWAIAWLGGGATAGDVRNTSCTTLVPSMSCTLVETATGPAGRAFDIELRNGPPTTLTIKTVSGQTLTGSWFGSGCGLIFGSVSGSAPSTITNTAAGELVFTAVGQQPTLNP